MVCNCEELRCDVCETVFTGRRPADGGNILCPDCLSEDVLPLINAGDPITDSVNEELEGGRGYND